MRHHIQMSYLGLDDQEVKVLKNMFQLVPELVENYQFNDRKRLNDADIILINASDGQSLETWRRISRQNKQATPILLSETKGNQHGARILQRPLQFRKLMDQLNSITRQELTTSSQTVGSTPTSAMRVLVVDDSYAVRKFMEAKLPELVDIPTHFDFAASGEEAIRKTAITEFDIIFLDVVMGGVDGYQVCKTIKSNSRSYVIMLTGKKTVFNKVRGTMSGCDGFVTKPPSDERLKEELQKALNAKR